jgi:hypothetical protein
MFWLGILTMIIINGILVIVLEALNVKEEIKDTIFGFWLLPFVWIVFRIHCTKVEKEEKEKLEKFKKGA